MTEIGSQRDSRRINRIEIFPIFQSIFADFEGNVGVICAATSVPATHIPGQGLIDCDSTICKFADKGVDTDSNSWAIPVVIVGVSTKQAVIWLNITAQIRVICTGGMDHYPFWDDCSALAVAVIIG